MKRMALGMACLATFSPGAMGMLSVSSAMRLTLTHLTVAGEIRVWGESYFDNSQYSSGTTQAIAAGGHSLALKTDGSIVGWGRNDYGQASPPAGTDYHAIVAGSLHSLAR